MQSTTRTLRQTTEASSAMTSCLRPTLKTRPRWDKSHWCSENKEIFLSTVYDHIQDGLLSLHANLSHIDTYGTVFAQCLSFRNVIGSFYINFIHTWIKTTMTNVTPMSFKICVTRLLKKKKKIRLQNVAVIKKIIIIIKEGEKHHLIKKPES